MKFDQLHPEQGFAASAFQVSERSRARSLYDLITGAMQRSLESGSERLSQPEMPSLKEIQSALQGSDTLLLEYKLGNEQSYLWVVSSDSLRGYRLPAKALIETSAKEVYSLLTARQNPPDERTTRIAETDLLVRRRALALSQTLLGPVAPDLGTKRLVVVGDGKLHYLPFEVLPTPDSIVSGESRPLVVDHEIVYMPSASVLVGLRHRDSRRERPTKAVAVLADPVFGGDDERVRLKFNRDEAPSNPVIKPLSSIETFVKADRQLHGFSDQRSIPRLPSSWREATQIEALVSPKQRLIATGFSANRDLVMSNSLAGYSIVHFATHGILDNKRPELSGLLLSGVDENGNRENGFLGLDDIYNLEFSADLIVLSSCNTALGKDVNGEGLIGLTQGFFYSGARSVMASLWKVDDHATADLMTQFYKGMMEDGLTPSDALRKAKIEMWRQGRWQAPYYWAAFTLQGEWDLKVTSGIGERSRSDGVALFLLLGVVMFCLILQTKSRVLLVWSGSTVSHR